MKHLAQTKNINPFKISIYITYILHLNLINEHTFPKIGIGRSTLIHATRLFQSHSFKQSLDAYQDCLSFCSKTDEADSMVFNISSAKATLEYILGDLDTALITLNSVLKRDPHHFLSLLRRSQVYKKKNKLKRALKDLQTIHVFSPDNLQISAFKTDIEHLLLKQGEQDISSDSESDADEDEEQQLNFCKLKLIDRKSIDKSCMKERKSRVTILGDTIFEYRIEQDPDELKQDEDFKDKAIRTFKQIELDDDDEEEDTMPIIQLKAPRRGRSILKNKGTSIFIHSDDVQSRRSRYLGRDSKLLNLIKNIDGKVIPSAEHEQSFNPTIKEVQFRKSITINEQQPQQYQLPVPVENKSTTSSRQRKSCLKRSSFDIPEVKTQTVRRSKFQAIDISKIDGHVITNPRRKSIQNNQLAISQGQVEPLKHYSDSDNDGSEHNIFGSKQFVLSLDVKQKLGITEDLSLSLPVEKSKGAKKSILKRTSSVMPIFSFKNQASFMNISNTTMKSKKSVMFHCTM